MIWAARLIILSKGTAVSQTGKNLKECMNYLGNDKVMKYIEIQNEAN